MPQTKTKEPNGEQDVFSRAAIILIASTFIMAARAGGRPRRERRPRPQRQPAPAAVELTKVPAAPAAADIKGMKRVT